MEYFEKSASKKIDFDVINSAALNGFEGLLHQWLPDGKQAGAEYKARNPTRHDDHPGSFLINTQTGLWSDFATGDGGKDPISLYAYLFWRDNQGAAAKALGDLLGLDKNLTKPDKPQKTKTEWTPIVPPPDATEPPKAHPYRGLPEASWCYRDIDGQPIGYVYRFEKSDGSKEVLPLSWCRNSQTGQQEWRWMAFFEPRSLYGLEKLKSRPEATVLIVEGEKCADAAAKQLPDLLCLTWPGGCKAVAKTDWMPLAGRKIIIWPDCDAQQDKTGLLLPEDQQPGAMAANQIAAILQALGCRVWMITLPLPGEKKHGWDVADAIDEGLTGASLRDHVRAHSRI
ncbi:DUF6371 domain-containing protein [Candidatus Methylobacter favarea]|nr:DUF6371 domain-containing protein [Candidatus Methylobacter favarea]